eukprot:TRINITY_DN6841_c0_g1_i2.p1 TRINITY_DN6841_c0_g1~~TRINITY_DN6841_c0_g1_i2.p1  ORF type:complete len:524 (-),score=102.88 TRINITY_DN6841_c0_g1_i2:43-1614(-)
MEGVARAFNIYLGNIPIPNYVASDVGANKQIMKVKSNVKSVRPVIVCAVLRGLTFTKEVRKSFIDLQDKLHQNIGRKRAIVSIGTHDLDTLQGPFTYETRKPEDIKFIALGKDKETNAVELFKQLEVGHLAPYLPLLKDKSEYPVITDSKGTVLSLPPIINGEHSKITLDTKNVFIEVTGTNLARCQIVLNIMVTMFSEYETNGNKVQVEYVEIQDSDNTVLTTPDLKGLEWSIDSDKANKYIGTKCDNAQVVKFLNQMGLRGTQGEGNNIKVVIPPTRGDILHAVDVYEDIAVAYGFNNIPKTTPTASTIGRQQPLNKLTELLRMEVAMAGFTEVLSFVLTSRADNYSGLRLAEDNRAVRVANSVSVKNEICRTRMAPGLLLTLRSNKQHSLPIRLFEVADVVLKDPQNPVGARNERHLCAVALNKTSDFELIHGLLDRVMLLLGVTPAFVKKETKGLRYSLEAIKSDMYLEGRGANVVFDGEVIGDIGVLHPEVLKHFNLDAPVSIVEINIEPFLKKRQSK